MEQARRTGDNQMKRMLIPLLAGLLVLSGCAVLVIGKEGGSMAVESVSGFRLTVTLPDNK